MSETPDPSAQDPVSAGAETLVEVLRDAADRGFGGQLIARADGTVECKGCDALSSADAIEVVRGHRLEGASDAADMMLVVEANCPACGLGGVLTLGYGPNATAEDEAVLADLDFDGG